MLALILLMLAGDVLPSPPPAVKADAGVAPVVSCQSVSDCWLGADGSAIRRPAKFKKRPLPQGDCGKNLLWLRHRLTCEKEVTDGGAGAICTSTFVGDAC